MNNPRVLSDEELSDFAKSISSSSVRFIMRRIQKVILSDPKNKDMCLNSFLTTLVVAMASINVLTAEAIAKYYESRIGKDIKTKKIIEALIKNINLQMQDLKNHH